MDWVFILTIVAALVGVIAGVVQVAQYFQERKKKSLEKDPPSKISTKVLSTYQNLPPRNEFIGREMEKRLLHEALDSRSFLISVDGIGGIGKSTLALEVVHERLQTRADDNTVNKLKKFDGFIWTSAKDRELTLNYLLDTIARVIDFSGVVQQPLDEKLHLIRQKLQEKPYLIIVDNFETITDDGIAEFLLNLPEPSKALITTRIQKLQQARAISIKGLPELEALALIRNEGKRLGLSSLDNAQDKTLMRLYEATGGAPLAIKWAVGQIKQKGQSLDTILASLHEAQGDIFVQVFERSWSLCTEAARQVLKIVPLFATPVSREALEKVSDIHHFVLDEALGQLVEMSLMDASDELDVTTRRYSVHPLTRAFALAELDQNSEIKIQAIGRLAFYYEEFTNPFRNWRKSLPEPEILDLEILNIYQTVKYCLNTGLYQQAYTIIDNPSHFIFTRGYWNDALEISSEIISRISNSEFEQKDLIIAKIKHWPMSPIHRHRGDLELAKKYTTEALHVFSQNALLAYEASALRNLGRIAHEKKEFGAAEVYLLKALKFYESENRTWEILVVTLNLAELAIRKGDLGEAWELCEKALPLAIEIDDLERKALIYAIKGEVELRNGNLQQAKEFFEFNLKMMRQIKRIDAIADSLFDLARVEINQKKIYNARPLLIQALDIYRQMGIHIKVLEIEKMLNQLEKPNGFSTSQ